MGTLVERTGKASPVRFFRWVRLIDRVAHAHPLPPSGAHDTFALLPEEVVSAIISFCDTDELYELFATSKFFYRLFVRGWHNGLFAMQLTNGDFKATPRELLSVARELEAFLAFWNRYSDLKFSDNHAPNSMLVGKEREWRLDGARWSTPWSDVRVGQKIVDGPLRTIAAHPNGIDALVGTGFRHYAYKLQIRLNRSMMQTRSRWRTIRDEQQQVDEWTHVVHAGEWDVRIEGCRRHRPHRSHSGRLVLVPPEIPHGPPTASLAYTPRLIPNSDHFVTAATMSVGKDGKDAWAAYREPNEHFPITPVLFVKTLMAWVVAARSESHTSIHFVYTTETRATNDA